MEFFIAAIWVLLLLSVGLLVRFCARVFIAFVTDMASSIGYSGADEYPNGADEPDGSSYSVVKGQVRLD